MEYDVAFYEIFAEEEEYLREYLSDEYAYFFTSKSVQDAGQADPPAPVISNRTQSDIPEAWFESVRAVFTRSTGYDHLTNILKRHGDSLSAGYLPKYAARAVAEHAFLMMLMLARKIDRQRVAMKQFRRSGLTGSGLRNKTLSIIGVGNIGSEIARIGAGMEMTLLGVDLVEREAIINQYQLEYVTLQEAVQRADLIVCALPLTDLTRGMLNYVVLRRAKSRAYLINPARGEITPPSDLLRLLQEKRLAGIALDVYDHESFFGSYLRGEITLDEIESETVQESINASQQLMEHPRVIATPHNAFNTEESTRRKARQTAESIHHYLENGAFPHEIPGDGFPEE